MRQTIFFNRFPAAFWSTQIRLVHFARFLVYALLSVILGNEDCVCCGKPSPILPLCPACRKSRLETWVPPEHRCQQCGRPLISEAGRCLECRRADEAGQPPAPIDSRQGRTAYPAACGGGVDSIFPIFSYQLWYRELVFLWKTRGVRLFTPIFGDILRRVIQDDLRSPTPPVLVPVPPRPGKIREKGWDQVNDLCVYLHRRHGIPVARLLRRRSKVQQKKLDVAHRIENAQSAFYLAKGYSAPLPPAVILLDDVRTTGATVNICAQVLKSAGIREVRALVLFGVN
ncbi:MAG: hypothetical protein LBS64_00230 [Spirochaetaceae bacterium]|jgi:ComF family protein|nr:hypothetical protein [Spirochaetaceae bacterium]